MKRALKALGVVALFTLYATCGQVIVESAKAAFWQWSKSSSSNGNSDPTISWIEGMPPSVVNDSGRAMMARLAEQAADTSGVLATTGGPTAYSVTTNQVFTDPLADGTVLGVTFNVDSGAGPTLAVDGGAAHPINSAPATGTTVSAGIPYTMVYRTAGGGAWLVRGGGGGGSPLGAIIPYSGSSEPGTGYKFANGQCISTTTYATYWALMGNPVPSYCAAGQFPVLDLRGRFLAGLDPGGARLTGASSGCGTALTTVGALCASGGESTTLAATNLPAYTPQGTVTVATGGSVSIGFAEQLTTAYNCCSGNQLFTDTAIGGTTTLAFTNPTYSFAGTSTAGTWNSTPFSRIPPTIAVNYLIRVQ